MPLLDQVDPEMRPTLEALREALPGGLNAIADITQRRAAALLGPIAPLPEGVSMQDRVIPGPPGEPDIGVRIYRPSGASTAAPLPGIYYIHGGGMILCDVPGEDAGAARLCLGVGAVVVSVEYRLAPEHPYPAAPLDCYAGLAWTAEHAPELGIDPHRLAIYGGSAGGGLAVASALLARDRRGPGLAFMMAIYPMIDDRHETPSSHEITDLGVWDRAGNIQAWDWYLGGAGDLGGKGGSDGRREPDQYAAPARARDVSGLPPSFIDVGTLDLFRDEDIAFAQRLMQAGVPTELHVHPGAYHAAEALAPEAGLSQRIWALRIGACRRALT